MANRQLENARVAILATDLFEEAELIETRKALDEAGAQTVVIAPKSGEIQAVQHDKKTQKVKVDMTLDQARPNDFDAVLLPGGAMNADALRMEPKAQDFVRNIDERRQTYRRDLPRAVAIDIGRPGQRPQPDQLQDYSG